MATMITTLQIKQIHILKAAMQIDDETYREMLSSFDVGTSKNLTETEAKIFIDFLSERAIAMKKAGLYKYDDFFDRDENMATPAQLRKIEIDWKQIINSTKKKILKKTLRHFLKNKFHIEDIRFLTKKRASDVISVLEKIKTRKELKAI